MLNALDMIRRNMMSFWMDIREFLFCCLLYPGGGDLLMVWLIGRSLRVMLLRLLFICSTSLSMSLSRLWMLFLPVSVQIFYLGIY